MITPVNLERRAKMRERNFQDRGSSRPWCVIALLLAAYQRTHGEKQRPAGWSSCWGDIDQAHVLRARGMGGCNSDATQVIDLCRGHHTEQEGRSEEFELRYCIDLRELAALQAANALQPEGPPA